MNAADGSDRGFDPETGLVGRDGQRRRDLRRGGSRILALAVAIGGGAAVVGGTSAGQATTGDDGVIIDLDADSRFELAVAGTVQFRSTQTTGPAGPSTAQPGRATPSTTVRPFGSTIDLDDTPLTTATSTTSTDASSGSSGGGSDAVVIRNADTAVGVRGMTALDSISYPWREALDGWAITFLSGRNDISGLVSFDRREIAIFVRSSHSDARLAQVMAHEIGHVVDWRFVDDDERGRWLDQRGLTGLAWYPPGTNDFDSPAGDFAEAFAAWQVGSRSAARIAGPVTDADLQLMAEIAQPNRP